MSRKFSNISDIEFRTTEIKPFKIFDSLKECITDVSMFFSKEGIKILSLDSATSTTLIHLNFRAENFDHFFVEEIIKDGESHPIDLNISILNLNKVLKSAQANDDSISWIHEKGSDDLIVRFTNSSKKEEREYAIKLQEPDEDEQIGSIDGIDEYSYLVTMPCTDFQRICRDLKSMNVSTVIIEHDCEQLVFETRSNIVEKSRISRRGINAEEGNNEESNLIMIKKPTDKTCYRDKFKFESFIF